MAEIIEARVRQKVGTLAEWNANPLILLKGEMAIVTNANGREVNYKFGNGVDRFSDLEFMIQYDQAAYVTYTATPAQPIAYTIVGEGTYGAITVGTGKMAVLGWNGTSWSKDNEVDLPVIPVANEVIEGGAEATSQDAVYRFSNPITSIYKIDYTPYRADGVGYDSSGNEVITPTQSIIRDMPVDPNQSTIYVNNTYSDSLYKYFFKDIDNNIIGTVRGYNNVNMVIPIPSGAVVFCTTLFRSATGQLKPDYSITYETLSSGLLTEAFGSKIEAKRLSSDNEVPTPTTLDNAVNLGYFNTNSVKDSDLGTEIVASSVNLLDMSYIVFGKFINSDGSIGTGADTNHIIENHPANEFAGKTVTLSGLDASTLKKVVIRDDNGVVLGSVLGISPVPKVFDVPSNAHTIDISLKRPTESVSNYEFVMLNIGSEALPYEPHFKEVISTIKGIEIKSSESGGGEDYDQSLNTFNDVEFNSVKTGLLDMTSWTVNLPTGAGVPPSEVNIGDAWIDTTSDSIKVRRS